MPANRKNSAAAFTITELVVVIGITVLLASLVLGAVRNLQMSTRRAKCASNLRQMAVAAIAYAEDNKGEFPWATRYNVPGYEKWCWDFMTPAGGKPEPGAMWNGYGLNSILQCPSYLNGRANWDDDPFTGYNYNAAYIGKAETSFDSNSWTRPTRMSHIKNPSATALFGDGHYKGGANKFMRAPQYEPDYDGAGTGIRQSGTQGFRHAGKTNVAFADGHVEALANSYDGSGKPGFVSVSFDRVNCGFISEDNRLYDLN